MGVVSVAEFKKYAKKMDDDATGEALYQVYVDSAESVVEDFLSYSVAEKEYVHTFYGDDRPYIALKAMPVSLTSVVVGGVTRSLTNISTEDEMMVDKTGAIFPRGSLTVVTYDGGFAVVPGIIKVTILEIAALLSMEAGENIGVTSTSFDGGNSRSFLNYTKFDKYLQKIERYRIRRLSRTSP